MSSSPTTKDTYSLAHTARCKLHIAADRPDRDLRFVLGHAFTLDNVMLRVVEIEKEASTSAVTHGAEQDEKDVTEWAARVNAVRPALGAQGERRVSFQNTMSRPLGSFSGGAGRNRSPPAPPRVDASSSEDEEDDDDDRDDRLEEEDDEDSSDELSLRRFGSGSARPPMLVEDDSDDDDVNEPASPEQMPSDTELQRMCSGPESKELKDLYGDVKTCPCHGHDQSAPEVQKVWEWPRKVGEKRIAVVQFDDGEGLKGF